MPLHPTIPEGMPMTRAYNVVDADGHILEPLDLWDHYIDPKFRDRAPRIVTGENGKQCLVMDEHVVGNNQRGIGGIGGDGARPGAIPGHGMQTPERKTAGFGAHK